MTSITNYNITSKFVENINNKHTEELIKELDLDIQTENDIHASYSSMTGILIVAIATLLVVIKRQRNKQKKQKKKIQRRGPEGTSVKIQFVGDVNKKEERETGDTQTTEEIVDMEKYNAMLDEEEMQCQEIQHVEKATTDKDYKLRYEGYMKGALERMRVRRT